MNNFKLLCFLTALLTTLSATAEEGYQHEINFGLINVDTFQIFSSDFSEFPIFGGTYRYYFDGLSGNLPSHIESHLEQKSWVQYDINLLFEFAPNLGGQYYFDNDFNLEYDITYLSNNSSFSGSNNYTILSDIVVNKSLNNHWQVGLGFVGVYNKSNTDDFYYDNNETNRLYMPSFHVRYTDIQGATGWDLSSRLAYNKNYLSWTGSATYLASSKSSYKFTLSVANFHEVNDFDFDQIEYEDTFLQISGSKEYWFSKKTSIDIGIGLLDLNGDNQDGIPWLPVFELNAKYRF